MRTLFIIHDTKTLNTTVVILTFVGMQHTTVETKVRDIFNHLFDDAGPSIYGLLMEPVNVIQNFKLLVLLLFSPSKYPVHIYCV